MKDSRLPSDSQMEFLTSCYRQVTGWKDTESWIAKRKYMGLKDFLQTQLPICRLTLEKKKRSLKK